MQVDGSGEDDSGVCLLPRRARGEGPLPYQDIGFYVYAIKLYGAFGIGRPESKQ